MVKLLDSISMQTGLPVDDKSIAQTFEERDNIPQAVRYIGMEVYVIDAKTKYQLKNGITNIDWEKVNIANSSELITDPDHLTVSQTEKDQWNSKAEGKHTHTKSEITDFPTSIKNPNTLSIQLNGGTATIYDGSIEKSINITANSVGTYNTSELNNKFNGKANSKHTHTKSEITDFPTSIKNPNALTISLNGTSQGAYDGSSAKSINITPANIGAQPAGSYAASSHTHSATQVTQDATHRFVTDAEKNTWNNKMSLSGGTFSEGAIVKGICGGGTDYWFIKGAGTDDNGYLEIGTQDNGDEPIYVRQYNTSNNVTHSITLMDANGNQTFNTINATGTVTCSDCVTTSDERLKKDIVKIDNALDKVNQLNGYTFLKDGDEQRTTGVLAQELLNVLPEAVFEREDGYYAVTYGNIVGLLIEAIKELQVEVKRLKGDE